MGSYIARRLAAAAGMLVALSIVIFLLFSALPSDPARLTCGKSCTPQIVEANRHRLGLDKPLAAQYGDFVSGIFVGRTFGSGTAAFKCSAPCLGYSFRLGEDVRTLLVQRLPVTAGLALGAFVIWIVAGVALGIFAALRRGSMADRTVLGLALVGYSFPAFFIGLLALFLIVIRWRLLPYPSYVSPFENPGQWFQTMLLPWMTLALLYAAYYIRLTRNQMLETLGEDFIRTARAKGLREGVVVRRHGLRAGLTPIVTSAGLDLAGLLGGAVITESIFTLPGIGSLAIDSVINADLPVITATVLLAASFIIIANVVVDILYAVIDPRVRLA